MQEEKNEITSIICHVQNQFQTFRITTIMYVDSSCWRKQHMEIISRKKQLHNTRFLRNHGKEFDEIPTL